MLRWLTALAVLTLLVSGNAGDRPVSAAHDGHTFKEFFQLEFIEDVPNMPSAVVDVYDCGGGHTHEAIIEPAIAQWNATGLVRFSYEGEILCDSEGDSLTDDVISVFHNQSINTADFRPLKYNESFRDNDEGTEDDMSMYRMRTGRIRIRVPDPANSFNSHTANVIAHELGHAAGLADLYIGDQPPFPPCQENPADPHNPLTLTIMSCGTAWPPGQHDIDNLDLLYKNKPTTVDNLTALDSYLSGSTATVVLAWTDRTYNEVEQSIWIDQNQNGVGEGSPITANRDQEFIEWQNLQPGTTYCFMIRQENGYGIQGDPSPPDPDRCIDTPPNQAGVYDLLAHWPGQEDAAFLHCIVRVEHAVGDSLNTAQQCNNDIPGLGGSDGAPPTWKDTCESLATRTPSECVPGELGLEDGADSIPGPPPPPPYSLQGPDTTATAVFYPEGTTGCGSTPCTILEWCFEDAGSPAGEGVGAYISWKIILPDPANPKSMQLDLDGDTVLDPPIDRVVTGDLPPKPGPIIIAVQPGLAA